MALLRQLFHLSNKKLFRATSLVSQIRTYAINADFTLTSEYPQIKEPQGRLDQIILDRNQPGNSIAVECGLTGKKLTYDQLRKNVRNLDKNLRKKLKLKENDVVAIYLPNVPEFLVSTYAVIRAGLIATTLNPLYTPEEISRQLQDSDAKAVITINELCPVAKAALALLKKDLPILTVSMQPGAAVPQGTIDFKEFVEDNQVDFQDAREKDTHDVIFMPYSSGTTGLPKGVELSNYNLATNLLQLTTPMTTIFKNATESYQDVVPAVLPLFHIYGFTATAAKLMHGCKVVTLPKFTPELYLQTIIKYKPQCLLLVPPILLFLTAHPSVKAEMLDSVRTVMNGAAPLGAADEERFLQKVKKDIFICQGYGLSETSPVVVIKSQQRPNVPGSIGEVVSNTICKVVSIDDDTKALGPNQPGELLVKGPQVMKQYHNRPEETKNTFTSDGFLKTGDMVYYTESQNIFITDRIKELIKVKGFQVPPAELEEIIRTYPGVGDVAVIGIPHEQYGEVPRAYVVPKPKTQVDAEKLDKFVSEKVAQYKQIKGGIAVVESIPKNASGKIMRRLIKEEFLKKGC